MSDKKITDVFFDLDHTLWDFDRNSALAFQRVFKKHKIALRLDEFIPVYEPINLYYWKQYRDEMISKEELRRGRLADTFALFKMNIPLSTIDRLANSYIEELPLDNHLFHGTVEILDYLHSKYRLHIITNGFCEVQYIKLKNGGIQNYFKTVTTSEEVGVKKPHSLIFETAMGKAAAVPHRSMMIGDSYEADIMGARNAGMHALFFDFHRHPQQTTVPTVHELLEIRRYL